MKRQILTIAAVLALVFAGAVFAQNANTTAPGPTIQKEPGLTNNNLPNPGNPIPLNEQNPPAETTGVAPETEQGEGMDVDVDTGAKAEGAVDVDVTSQTDADTDASGVDETAAGTYTGTADDAAGDSDALPATAGELPALLLLGLLALCGAFALRMKRA